MDKKRYILATLAVFVTTQILDFLIHGLVLAPTYAQLADIWRPDMPSKMWIFTVVSFVTSFCFVYIFNKGYEGKGIREGVRFGLIIGLFAATPYAYATYAMIAIPYWLALFWFCTGMLQYVVLGVVAAALVERAAR